MYLWICISFKLSENKYFLPKPPINQQNNILTDTWIMPSSINYSYQNLQGSKDFIF